MTVEIRRNTHGDTRVAKYIPTIDQFGRSNYLHAKDVERLMCAVSQQIKHTSEHHDWTKRSEPYKSMFYQDMIETMKEHIVFDQGEWAKMHYEIERHHLDKFVPDDVTLVDVIEMLCDCVAAGLARKGMVDEVTIPAEVLEKAVKNTVEWLKAECKVVEDE